MHWIRELLRQDMVVARQTTATYIEVWFSDVIYFFIRYSTRTGFSLVKKLNRKPIPCTGARG